MKLSTSTQTISSRSRLAVALMALAVPACLGGDGKADPDAAPGTPDARTTDAAPGPDGGEASACAMAMQDAPTGGAAPSFADALPTATRNTWDGQTIPTAGDANYPGGKYRTLTPDEQGEIHPGCSTEGITTYTPANIPGYPCAAKEYPFPEGKAEDESKPIVILVHGNSDSPAGYEGFVLENPDMISDFEADRVKRDQLAELLPAAGYRTIAVDMRITLVDDPGGSDANFAQNIDHGWAVPITQELIKQVIVNNPDRKVSVVGFSLGATVVRDALRRLFVQFQDGDWDINVFSRVQDVIVASGAHHGVSTFPACSVHTTMRGTITCEMGQRNTYTQTEFHKPLNGPSAVADGEAFGGWYETPCADGSYAFGLRDACGGNTVAYTTITMSDISQGAQQDEFVSEHAARLYPLACANNITTGLNDFDTSGYLGFGLFRNHFGAVRSPAGLMHIIDALGD